MKQNTINKSQVDPLRGWEVKSLAEHETSRGVYFRAVVFVEGKYIGEIENLGDGGCTHPRMQEGTRDIWTKGTADFLEVTDVDFEPLDMMLEWMTSERKKNTPLNRLQETVYSSILN